MNARITLGLALLSTVANAYFPDQRSDQNTFLPSSSLSHAALSGENSPLAESPLPDSASMASSATAPAPATPQVIVLDDDEVSQGEAASSVQNLTRDEQLVFQLGLDTLTNDVTKPKSRYDHLTVKLLVEQVLRGRGLNYSCHEEGEVHRGDSSVFHIGHPPISYIPMAAQYLNSGSAAICILNINNNHWITLVLFPTANQINLVIYDSLGSSNENNAQILEFIGEMNSIMNGRRLNIIRIMHRQQDNSIDCGPFSVENAAAFAASASNGTLQGLLSEYLTASGAEHHVNGLEANEILQQIGAPLPRSKNAREIRKKHRALVEGMPPQHQAAGADDEVILIDDEDEAKTSQQTVGTSWYKSEEIRQKLEAVLKDSKLPHDFFTREKNPIPQPSVYVIQLQSAESLRRACQHFAQGNPAICILNINGNHWITAVLFPIEGQINLVLYDSFGASNEDNPQVLELIKKLKESIRKNLNVIHIIHQQQFNKYDCGPLSVENAVAFGAAALTGSLLKHLGSYRHYTGQQQVMSGPAALSLLQGIGVQLPQNRNARHIRTRHEQLVNRATAHPQQQQQSSPQQQAPAARHGRQQTQAADQDQVAPTKRTASDEDEDFTSKRPKKEPPQPQVTPAAEATPPQPQVTPAAEATPPQPQVTPAAVATPQQPQVTPAAVATQQQPQAAQAVAAQPELATQLWRRVFSWDIARGIRNGLFSILGRHPRKGL